MSRPIDADALMKAIKAFRWFGVPNTLKLMFDYLKIIINEQPTIEAESVSLRIEVDYNDFSEEVAETAREEGWHRKRYFCPCGQRIKIESWDKERCFGGGTILRDNKMPNYCPNCGAKIDGGKDDDGTD